jgi:adhesin HecA-like repeat protein
LGHAGNAANPQDGSVNGSGSLATDATFSGGSLPLPNNLPLPGAAPPRNEAQQPTLELSLPTAPATPQASSKRPTAKRTSPSAQQRTASLPPRSNQSNDKLMSMRSTQIHVGLNGPQLYHLVVANQDQVKLSGLIVRLDIPAGVQVQPQTATLGRAELENVSDGSVLVTWSFEGLSPGQQASVPLHLTTQSPNNFDMSLEWTFHPVTGSIPVEVRSPRLELALEGPKDVNYGQANTYRLHVSNQGSADATDVTAKLSAQQFGSSSIQIGTIAAGASETIDVELVFNEAGKIVIAADVTAQGEVAANAQNQVQVRQALLELLMEAPEMAYHGSAVPYKLVVKNSGDAVASQSKVVVTLPTGAKLDSPPSATSLENGSLVWNVPDVRPGASAELTFQLSLSREGENQLVAHCTTPSGKSAQTSIATLVKAVTDLKLVVSDPSAPATVGGEVQYELTLLNRGSKTVEQVSVAAMFSRGIEPKRAEGHRHQVMPGQVRFEPITRIEPGETVTLRVVAMAEAAGMHRFRAEVNTADAEVKLVQEESTEFLESIRRTATVNSGSAVVR